MVLHGNYDDSGVSEWRHQALSDRIVGISLILNSWEIRDTYRFYGFGRCKQCTELKDMIQVYPIVVP